MEQWQERGGGTFWKISVGEQETDVTHPPVRQASTLLSHKHIYIGTNTLCAKAGKCVTPLFQRFPSAGIRWVFLLIAHVRVGKSTPLLYSYWLNIRSWTCTSETLGPIPTYLPFHFYWTEWNLCIFLSRQVQYLEVHCKEWCLVKFQFQFIL